MKAWTTIWSPLEAIRNSKESFVRPKRLIWYGGTYIHTHRHTDPCIELRYAQLINILIRQEQDCIATLASIQWLDLLAEFPGSLSSLPRCCGCTSRQGGAANCIASVAAGCLIWCWCMLPILLLAYIHMKYIWDDSINHSSEIVNKGLLEFRSWKLLNQI